MRKEINLGELSALIAEGPAGQDKLKKQAAAIRDLQEALVLTWKRQRPYEVPIPSDENTIRFGLIGDTQIGSGYQRLDALLAFYKRCHEESINLILHAGDVLDGWKVYKGQEFELHPYGRSWADQRTMFSEKVPQIPGVTTVFITGNHDASFKNLVGMTVGEELQRVRPDWKYIGADVGTVALKTKQGQVFNVMLVHPSGGTAYALSYKMQKFIEALGGGTKPDLLAMGHYHKADHLPQYRNVCGIQVGCFQSQTPFMARGGIAAHIGGWIIEVTLGDRKKLTSRIKAEFVSFYEEQA